MVCTSDSHSSPLLFHSRPVSFFFRISCLDATMLTRWECRLVLNAFHKVLLQKQSRYRKVIEWLEETMEGIKGREGEMCRRLNGVIVAGEGGEEGEE